MKTRLPTVVVYGCSTCPFAIEAYEHSSDDSSVKCCFPVSLASSDFDSAEDVWTHCQAKTTPDWCPGLKYDIIVEFENE